MIPLLAGWGSSTKTWKSGTQFGRFSLEGWGVEQREGGRDGGREGGTEGQREGGREGRREGGRRVGRDEDKEGMEEWVG